jgi:hypothetical protein
MLNAHHEDGLGTGRFAMRFMAMMGLGFCVFVTGLTLPTTDANAVVCARGYYRAGCVGPRGAVGVRRGYYHGGAVVHRGYYHRGIVVRGRRW